MADEHSMDKKSIDEVYTPDANVRSILLMTRLIILFILCGLATGLGIGAYQLLSNQEFVRFNRNLNEMSIQISNGFRNQYSRFKLTEQITSNIYRSYIRESAPKEMPFVTLPGNKSITFEN